MSVVRKIIIYRYDYWSNMKILDMDRNVETEPFIRHTGLWVKENFLLVLSMKVLSVNFIYI